MTTFSRFRNVIAGHHPDDFSEQAASKPNLRIAESSDGNVRTYYAPFDFTNKDARLVLVGITPGREQMNNALRAACEKLQEGGLDSDVLAAAKRAASFSGEMRKNLVSLLDRYGFHRRLGLHSSVELWGEGNRLAQFTSALRNPVFSVDGTTERNYTGASPTLSTYFGFKGMLRDLRSELLSIGDALIVPLGDKVAQAIQTIVAIGDLPISRVLSNAGRVSEFPHPSGANRETQNLALYDELPPKEDYAQMMLRNYVAKRAKIGRSVSLMQQRRYLETRHSYWERSRNSRAALESL